MSLLAKSRLVVSDWEETPYAQVEGGAALARGTSAAILSGDFEGKGTCTWLLTYPPAGVPSFVGTQTFEGTLAGRAGTFVLQLEGTFEENAAKVRWSVMPDSATGELRGLRGQGGYRSAADAPSVEATLEYELA
jgi:hypothetical protein